MILLEDISEDIISATWKNNKINICNNRIVFLKNGYHFLPGFLIGYHYSFSIGKKINLRIDFQLGLSKMSPWVIGLFQVDDLYYSKISPWVIGLFQVDDLYYLVTKK